MRQVKRFQNHIMRRTIYIIFYGYRYNQQTTVITENLMNDVGRVIRISIHRNSYGETMRMEYYEAENVRLSAEGR
jgi:hypothetical protein